MNLSDWIKAAALVTQHKQEVAIAETDQLSSMPLSQIAMDDSGPPVVHYDTHMPTVMSMPTVTDVHMHSSQQENSYQQIISGIPQGSLCMVLIPVSLVVHVVGFYIMLLHLIALGNSVRVYPGIGQGPTFYLYKDK